MGQLPSELPPSVRCTVRRWAARYFAGRTSSGPTLSREPKQPCSAPLFAHVHHARSRARVDHRASDLIFLGMLEACLKWPTPAGPQISAALGVDGWRAARLTFLCSSFSFSTCIGCGKFIYTAFMDWMLGCGEFVYTLEIVTHLS